MGSGDWMKGKEAKFVEEWSSKKRKRR